MATCPKGPDLNSVRKQPWLIACNVPVAESPGRRRLQCHATDRALAPPSAAKPRITVLGAGVVGLSTALVLQEAFLNGSVVVAAKSFTRDTTSHGAAGLWKPFKLGAEQDQALINKWGSTTLSHMQRLHASPSAVSAGVIATTGYLLHSGRHTEPVEFPEWAPVVQHIHRLEASELAAFAQPYADGFMFSTYVCEGGRYLPWLTAQFEKAGGRVVAAAPSSPEDLAELLDKSNPSRLDCDVLVNCAGLNGARDLWNDDSVYAVRGQVIRVCAPWIKNYYNIDGSHYIIPNIDSVVLGGTTQERHELLSTDAADRQAILNATCTHLPSLRGAEVLEDWVGLRPCRPSIRLEAEQWQRQPVIHSYGHGGAGVTLHWGIAQETLQLVKQVLA